jgi:hypothetical protein
MFGFGKKQAPELLPSNKGIGVSGKVRFSNAQRSWTEHFHVVKLAARVLAERGRRVRNEKSWLVDKASGFILLPRIVDLEPLENGGVRTTTTIQTNHPALVPDGVFEYQHSTGDSMEDSLRKGFDQWAQTDLVALLDALKPEPKTCPTLNMGFPEKDGKPAYSRRAVLGPVVHYVQRPEVYEEETGAEEKKPEAGGDVQGEQCERHAFCPCCLLTNSLDAFTELIEGPGFYALRLFAAREGEGGPQADCRVNGDDWEKGAEALRKYAATWPEAGYEFRKQYVVLHTVEGNAK